MHQNFFKIHSNEAPNGVPPEFWALLDKTDQASFLNLQKSFVNGNVCHKNISNDPKSFYSELMKVKDFIHHRKENSEIRGIVAGIFFNESYVVVNIQRLKTLFNKCKSSMNKSLQLLQFVSVKSNVKSYVVSSLPILQNHQGELRQWTLRHDKNLLVPREKIPLPIPIIGFSFSTKPEIMIEETPIPNTNLISQPNMSIGYEKMEFDFNAPDKLNPNIDEQQEYTFDDSHFYEDLINFFDDIDIDSHFSNNYESPSLQDSKKQDGSSLEINNW